MKHATCLKKPLILFSFIVFALSLAGCRHGEEGRMDYLAEKVSNELKFDQQQNDQWNQLLADLKQIRTSMSEKREATRTMIVEELKSDQLDEARLIVVLEQHQQAINESFRTLLPKINELHASLTPEQKETLMEWLEKHRERGHGFMH
ncbi:Spy/CpxP family protein refolding chaperone [Marinobacter sp.]|uniref:Spy/CpxP family protein refolding chaperone n=1 Tax=Marinobacter sp. TaxID=50741 RepID=UPI003A94BCED